MIMKWPRKNVRLVPPLQTGGTVQQEPANNNII